MFFDGAFGTYYIAKTNDHQPCERANLTDKDTVVCIHKEYISAGVDAIKTNTFATTEEEVIAQGYKLAKEAAAGTNVKVYADIGPKQDEEEYLKVIDAFISLGAENFLFETLASLDELVPGLEAIKHRVKKANVIVSFAVSRDGFTQSGQPFKTLLSQAANNAKIDAAGLNCICGPAHILELVRELDELPKPLCIMPNSGYPSTVNGRTVYNNNAQYFAEKILEIMRAGGSILGGCCGTTPEHIACAIKAARKDSAGENIKPNTAPISFAGSSFKNKLERKTIAVELDPPVGCDVDFIMQSVDRLKNIGVDIITLADSPMARARADSFLTASLIKREKNIDVLPHLTCRDKNFIAIKGALLGASFYGIDQVLAVTGDPVVSAENYRNPGVFNFNSKELISYIKSLNNKVFAGKGFRVGGALNVNAPRFDTELKRCREKVAAGAGFLYSQPMFSGKSIENFKQAGRELNCKLFAGILPIVSYKNAVFLNNELAGIDIPQDVVDSLKDKTPPEVQAISTEFCRDVINQTYHCADGFYIMTPLKKVELVCEIIKSTFL